MSHFISRRDFFKLSSIILSSSVLSPLKSGFQQSSSDLPNILIVVYDAFTATDMSLYGYQRETTPNITRLADKAIVYHNHFAGGHWTYPGTATLLTGVHTWTHRGFRRGTEIVPPYDQENIFTFFDDYNTTAYTHNYVADEILKKLNLGIDDYYEKKQLFLRKSFILNEILDKDYDIAAVGRRKITTKSDYGYTSSLFFSHLTKFFDKYRERQLDEFFIIPPSVSGSKELFMLEDATDWIVQISSEQAQPYLSYIHMFPPHAPYAIRKDFGNLFNDDQYKPIRKPDHFLSSIQYTSYEDLIEEQTAYNKTIRYVDSEFGRLMENLESSGQLENTWVILTSDHGEIFERGLSQHNRPAFYDPLVKVPLLIFPPGQTERIDIHQSTSAVDLIPTLLHLAGKPAREHLEGMILPPFSESPDDRSIFMIDARDSDPYDQLSQHTAMILKWPYKLIQYIGYEQIPDGDTFFELFNLEEDPEELVNLYDQETQIASDMQQELTQEINKRDKPIK